MLTKPEDIQEAINSMEKEIAANTLYISALMAFSDSAKEYDKKVINKRFTTVLNEHLPQSLKLYSFNFSYKRDAIDFTVYQKDRTSDNYSKTFRFSIEQCFTETDSGKLRINAKGFAARCLEIRSEIIKDSENIRHDIDSVYPMLADAQALYNQAEEFYNKYSYSLKAKFRCNYHVTTY